jgi:ACS family hexuronate transporter-like MFS transporter
VLAPSALQSVSASRSEHIVVGVLCVVVGVANVEIFGISYLTPFLKSGLSLSNEQIGLLLSVFWITFAASSYLSGSAADKHISPKILLQIALPLFAVGSIASGLTSSFAMLLVARILMGLLDAPVYLLPQSIVVLESPPARRGLNMGLVQNLGGAILGGFIAPLLLVNVAASYGWRAPFFLVIIPALICTALVSRCIPAHRYADATSIDRPSPERPSFYETWQLLRLRNVWLSATCSCCVVAYVTVSYGFLPLFLVQVRQLAPASMSLLVSMLGLSNLVLGIVLPAASDRIGRKPIMVGASLIGAIGPLAVMYFRGPTVILATLIFVGWALIGAGTLTFATIPCESVEKKATSTVLGFILGSSTLVGGVGGPACAGWAADKWGPSAPLVMTLGCCALVFVLSLALTETAPIKRTALTCGNNDGKR